MHELASNFVRVFLSGSYQVGVILCVAVIFIGIVVVILCIVWPFHNESFSLRPLTRNHSYIMVY